MSKRGKGARIVLAAWLATLSPALAAQSAELENRIARLEQLLSSGALIELLERVDRLRAEVQQLRGQVELAAHELEQMKGRQRELYLDLDRRLARVESGAVAAVPEAGAPEATSPEDGEAGDGSAQSDSAPEASAETAPSAAPASVDPMAEQEAYQAAFDLLKAGRYEQASDAFQAFLAEYPAGRYADNAQYWLGEAYYVTRRFEPALAEFRTLVDRFPESSKLTHALLKIGYIQDELGQREAAERTLEALVADHPQTTAARLARERLQRMRSGSG